MCIPTTYYCIEHRDDPNAIQIMNELCGIFTHKYFVWSYSITNDQHYIIARKNWCNQRHTLVRIHVFIDFLINNYCHTYTIKYKIYPHRLNISFRCHLQVEQCLANTYPTHNNQYTPPPLIRKKTTNPHKNNTIDPTIEATIAIDQNKNIPINNDSSHVYPTLTIQRLEALNKQHLSQHTTTVPTWADMVRNTTPKFP